MDREAYNRTTVELLVVAAERLSATIDWQIDSDGEDAQLVYKILRTLGVAVGRAIPQPEDFAAARSHVKLMWSR